MVKDRCEWSHDDHSLNAAILSVARKKMNALEQDDSFREGTA